MELPQILEEVEMHSGWLRIIKRKLLHATGGVQEYEIVNPDTHSVSAVVFDDNGDVVVVELYRFAQHQRLLELPAGAVEAGESFEQAIGREILEETGYAGELQEVGKHFIAAEHGVTRHVFVARNCRRIAEAAPEPSEIDEGATVRVLPLQEFIALVRSGSLTETGAAYMALDHMKLLS